jgi:hypothetical protein
MFNIRVTGFSPRSKGTYLTCIPVNELGSRESEVVQMRETQWAQPNPQALLEASDPPVPDEESLLSEVGASYPMVAYPASQSTEDAETAVDRTIYAGLVWPY